MKASNIVSSYLSNEVWLINPDIQVYLHFSFLTPIPGCTGLHFSFLTLDTRLHLSLQMDSYWKQTLKVCGDPIYTCMNSHLPQIKAKSTNIFVEIQLVIWSVVWIVNLRMDPFAFVVGIINLFRLPLSLPKTKQNNRLQTKVTEYSWLDAEKIMKYFMWC